MPDCKDSACPLVPRIEALERDSEHNKEAHKDFYARLENSHTSVALIEERMNQIKADTEEIKEAVQEMKDKPAKRWDGAIDKVICTVIGVVVGFLLKKAGVF